MNIKEVENLAELSQIELSEEEKINILKDMDGILDYVKQIENIEVGDINPDLISMNVFREDEEIQDRDFSKDLIKDQFASSYEDFLKVKKIL